jgi:hypothetical protein
LEVVAAEIINDDEITRTERRVKNPFDVEAKLPPSIGPLSQPWCFDAVTTQGRMPSILDFSDDPKAINKT